MKIDDEYASDVTRFISRKISTTPSSVKWWVNSEQTEKSNALSAKGSCIASPRTEFISLKF